MDNPKKEKVKPRLPMPTKPPKAEPNPKGYTRKPKHKKKWQEQADPNEGIPIEDK